MLSSISHTLGIKRSELVRRNNQDWCLTLAEGSEWEIMDALVFCRNSACPHSDNTWTFSFWWLDPLPQQPTVLFLEIISALSYTHGRSGIPLLFLLSDSSRLKECRWFTNDDLARCTVVNLSDYSESVIRTVALTTKIFTYNVGSHK